MRRKLVFPDGRRPPLVAAQPRRPSRRGAPTTGRDDPGDGVRARRGARRPPPPGRRLLLVDGQESSYVDLDDLTRLDFAYVRRIGDLLDLHAPPGEPLHAVHVGGGGFTLPRYLSATRPGSRSVTFERDGGLVDVARDALGLRTSARMRVRVGDGRELLAALPERSADAVVVDAFDGPLVPAHLTTVEFVREVRRVLRPGGLCVLNVIDIPPLELARAGAATLLAAFRHGVVLAAAAAAARQGGRQRHHRRVEPRAPARGPARARGPGRPAGGRPRRRAPGRVHRGRAPADRRQAVQPPPRAPRGSLEPRACLRLDSIDDAGHPSRRSDARAARRRHRRRRRRRDRPGPRPGGARRRDDGACATSPRRCARTRRSGSSPSATATTRSSSSATTRPTCSPRRSSSCIPGVKISIGPPIDGGFYYDFEFPRRRDAVGGRPPAHRGAHARARQGRRALRPRGRDDRRRARALQGRGPAVQGRARRGPRRATKASRRSRSTATARSPTSAAARTRPAPAASARSSS